MKDKIHVLFVCGYGVGSSAMVEGIVSKALKKRKIPCEVEHTAAGEAVGFFNWVDIVAVSKKLIDIVNLESFPGKSIIVIENIMDGEKIGAQIEEVVREKFPELLQENKE